MAAQYPLHSQPEAAARAMYFDCFLSIVGTAWVVAAIVTQQRAKDIHIPPDEPD